MIKKLLLLSFLVSSFSVFAAAAGEMSEAKPMKRGDAEKGSKLSVPKQELEEGKKLVFEDVLMLHDGKSIQFGSPKIAGAKVMATVLEHCREKKILVYKKKRRKGYARKNGHRQWFTNIEIQNIQVSKARAKPAAKPKKAEPKEAKKEK